MNKTDNLNILKENLVPSVEKLCLEENWVLQQDNDSKDTAKIVKEWLKLNMLKQLDYPPQSLYLNLTEQTIISKESLKSVLMEEWRKISLVKSMQRGSKQNINFKFTSSF